MEYELEGDTAFTPAETPLQDAPIHVAVVDMSGSAAYVDAVQQSLQALLETLPRAARFALITYSDKIGVYRCAALLVRSHT
jgi:hypothetical protein